MQGLNQEALSVSQYNKRVKDLLENQISSAWVRGEVSNLRKQSSGHNYFTLKDNESQLSCVLFRGNALSQSDLLKEGQQIIVYGDINVYEPRGSYQLIARIILQDGQGQLQIAFEQLKQKLAAEGLFSSERKKPIPTTPKTIGIITSSTGAAIKDFISVLKRRGWHGHLVILPSKVQGKEAAPELVNQIERAQRMHLFDLLVLSRGGGSLEDLWPFNEESVVRALARCPIPTISAVGHEIDFTLADFAADLRAETPTAAAEIISSHFKQAQDQLFLLAKNLLKFTISFLTEWFHQLEKLNHQLKPHSPLRQIEHFHLKFDDFSNRISKAFQFNLFQHLNVLNQRKLRLIAFFPETPFRLAKSKIDQIHKRLINNSVESALNRGFAVIKDKEAHYIIRQASLTKGDIITVQFADGDITTKIL